jgi:hypothetical protein
MNIKKNLLTLSIVIGSLLSTSITFSRWGGGGWVAPVVVTGVVAGSIAANNARARDREAYYQDQAARDRDARYREEDARRRERAAERRHEKEMAALRGSQDRRNAQPVNMDDDYSDE